MQVQNILSQGMVLIRLQALGKCSLALVTKLLTTTVQFIDSQIEFFFQLLQLGNQHAFFVHC